MAWEPDPKKRCGICGETVHLLSGIRCQRDELATLRAENERLNAENKRHHENIDGQNANLMLANGALTAKLEAAKEAMRSLRNSDAVDAKTACVANQALALLEKL